MPFLVRELFHELSPIEWMVWCFVFAHRNREGYCYLLNETIAEKTGLSLNTVQTAKHGLIRKGWLTNCGQQKRGANLYQTTIGIPENVRTFIEALWGRLQGETWWIDAPFDHFNWTDHQLDWLVAWRVIRTLREIDPKWTTRQEIGAQLAKQAHDSILATLRRAAKGLQPGRGEWWLFGDGFDDAQ